MAAAALVDVSQAVKGNDGIVEAAAPADFKETAMARASW